MTRMLASHGCPVPGCQVLRDKSCLLCEAHWGKLPKTLKQNVLNTYAQARAASAHETSAWNPNERERHDMWRRFRRAAHFAIHYFTGYGERAA